MNETNTDGTNTSETIRMKQCHFQTASGNRSEKGLNLPEYWHENPEFGFIPLCRFIRVVLFDRFIRITLFIPLEPMPKKWSAKRALYSFLVHFFGSTLHFSFCAIDPWCWYKSSLHPNPNCHHPTFNPLQFYYSKAAKNLLPLFEWCA
jgi:hypothetical protein